jgi:alkylhydroperoxidase family enzyme
MNRGDKGMPRIPPQRQTPIPLNDGTGNHSMTSLFQVMAHRPEIMQHATHLLEATMRSGTVDPALKELLAIRVSQVNHCFY